MAEILRTYTTYELNFGGGNLNVRRRFRSLNDAATRFAEVVTRLDRDENFSAAFASLYQRNPDGEGTGILGWTKTSDERRTDEGEDF